MANNVHSLFSGQLQRRKYVRGQDQITPFRPKAKGRVHTEKEVSDYFGRAAVEAILAEGSFGVAKSSKDIGGRLRAGREALQLSVDTLAEQTGLPVETIRAAEDGKRVAVRSCDLIAVSLGLDELYLSAPFSEDERENIYDVGQAVVAEIGGNMGGDILSFSEAMWALRMQRRLRPDSISRSMSYLRAMPSAAMLLDFVMGHYSQPNGVFFEEDPLFAVTRIRALLGVPVSFALLPATCLGATVVLHDAFGVVLNIGSLSDDSYGGLDGVLVMVEQVMSHARRSPNTQSVVFHWATAVENDDGLTPRQRERYSRLREARSRYTSWVVRDRWLADQIRSRHRKHVFSPAEEYRELRRQRLDSRLPTETNLRGELEKIRSTILELLSTLTIPHDNILAEHRKETIYNRLVPARAGAAGFPVFEVCASAASFEISWDSASAYLETPTDVLRSELGTLLSAVADVVLDGEDGLLAGDSKKRMA